MSDINDFAKLFNSELGEKVLKSLSSAAGESNTSFDDNPYRTAFNEGKRDLMIFIRNKIAAPTRNITTQGDTE